MCLHRLYVQPVTNGSTNRSDDPVPSVPPMLHDFSMCPIIIAQMRPLQAIELTTPRTRVNVSTRFVRRCFSSAFTALRVFTTYFCVCADPDQPRARKTTAYRRVTTKLTGARLVTHRTRVRSREIGPKRRNHRPVRSVSRNYAFHGVSLKMHDGDDLRSAPRLYVSSKGIYFQRDRRNSSSPAPVRFVGFQRQR